MPNKYQPSKHFFLIPEVGRKTSSKHSFFEAQSRLPALAGEPDLREPGWSLPAFLLGLVKLWAPQKKNVVHFLSNLLYYTFIYFIYNQIISISDSEEHQGDFIQKTPNGSKWDFVEIMALWWKSQPANSGKPGLWGKCRCRTLCGQGVGLVEDLSIWSWLNNMENIIKHHKTSLKNPRNEVNLQTFAFWVAFGSF